LINPHPISEELQTILVRSRCSSIEWLENIWKFEFEGVATLGIECPWRIVTSQRVEIADTDDKQWFGLPEPVDATAQAQKLLITPVVKVFVDAVTADLWVEFEGNIRLETWTNSSGYEPWNCCTKTGLCLYAQGGGNVTIFRPS
jgi:hypothetical protein